MKTELIDTSASRVKTNDELIQTTPPGFIILKNMDENYIGQILPDNSEQLNEKSGEVYLTISQLSCTYAQSKPNGFINKAIPDSYLNKYNLKPPAAP